MRFITDRFFLLRFEGLILKVRSSSMRGGMTVFALYNRRSLGYVGTPVMRMVATGNPQHTPKHGRGNRQPANDQHHNGHSEAHGFLRLLHFSSLSNRQSSTPVVAEN
jgi:hypothetical protein